MTKEERELSIEYLEKIKEDYIEGNAYERHPLPEYYAIENAIKALKQEAKWIPVTERLPEEMFGCLVTVWDANPKTSEEFENILPEFVGYDGETWNGADGKPIAFEVVAWMPLPKPYGLESEE